MVSMEAFFDRARAEAFIEALFHVVLDRTKISEVEREYWTSFLIEHQDPTDVLTRFGQSKEYQVRRISLQEAHRGFPPGHFYSPIVNIPEVEQDATRLFTRHASLGVRLNVLEQKKVFGALSDYWKEAPFGDEAVSGLRYYYNNTSYAFGDAFGYWGMLCHFKPNRIIEIGCGFTSALALDAIDHLKLGTTCTFIDPYPDLLLRVAHPISERHNLIAERVQAVDPRIVESLERNDILFIDSSHVLKTGSDVHFEVAELLPRLRSGVVVHFHDIFDSFEYPAEWVVGAGQSWNELYFLQAFLMFNQEFNIIYFNDFFAKEYPDDFARLPEQVRRRIRLNPGGGLWLQKS